MLSYNEILKRIQTRQIVITPLLDPLIQIQQGGIDLRLGNVFIVPRRNLSSSLDPIQLAQAAGPLENYQESVHVPFGDAFVIHPGEIVLGVTIEYVVLPNDVFGILVGRSSYGRLGLTIATAVKVNPGNKACITLELVNGGHLPIKLYPGTRIGQIILMSIENAEGIPLKSRYDNAIGPEFSKLHLDEELPFLSQSLFSSQLVIGVTGMINAGKSRVAKIIAETMGFVPANISRVVGAEIAKEQRKRPRSSEEIYQRKIEIREQRGKDSLAREAFREALHGNPRGIVFDELAHPAEIRYLKKHPNFRLVAVVADREWRWQQFRDWHFFKGRQVEHAYFDSIDQRNSKGLDLNGDPSDYADYLDECIHMAEFSITSGVDDTDDQIDAFLASLPGSWFRHR